MNEKISTVRKWWLVFFMGVVSATGPLSMDMYLPGLPEMQRAFHSSASTLQLSITFCLIGLAVGQLIVGPISDRIGRRVPLVVGFGLYAVTSLMLIFTTNIYLFIGVRLIQGLAGSTGQVLSRAVARDLFNGHELTKFYAMLMAVNGAFPIIAPIIGGALLSIVQWQGIFVLLFVIGILVMVGVLCTLPETLKVTNNEVLTLGQTFKGLGAMFGKRQFILIALTQGLIFGALFSYISASSFVFQTYFHMTVGQFSLLYAINGLGIILGNNLPGYLPEQIKDSDILNGGLIGGMFAGVLLVGSLLLRPMAILVIIPLFIVVFCVGVVNTVATSMAMSLGGRTNAGAASAVLGLLMNIIGALASPLAGIMGTQSYAPLAWLIFGFEFLGLILFQLTRFGAKSSNYVDK
ncbi:multidrug effflux MFS transporter [Pediococcus pentosaceus]|jgi:DHA1 family bicyclomycin/chloramphenicol resistance-like MFS transporter|uniref:Bcr/CflA family efflux transporter n=1 Tax=Pediococcus pentosaceus TaxID=1255 RepID=A0ABD7X5I1_PEDPE|nr:multidrug effflux MFS transporter [Pediococcus pentosaceus]AXR44173.1 Bcr/CflA family drug resistance efflux transporter [Pediococcus pentosaceus]KAF0519396.1 Bcr/CflA family efflux MFS transporter [Pediococcus pentosaceus]MBF7111232.1 multidrug effflux MFS transporter [Pediococcus pentosaceus]MBF7116466.1 multidrug effflux MFS transporter [Pediococcus pentosaceus]MBF7118205.1 multidrug effflux MFS transporter [Pediococcus pentosaceus]